MNEDTSTLRLLETIAQDADLPQRSMAARTGLNLAKVNFLLRRLKEKGLIKLRRVRDNPHKLRYLYLLTPEGAAEKTRLTYRFLRRQLNQYNRAEQRVRRTLERMEAAGVRRLLLWGRNEISELCLRLVAQRGGRLRVVAVVDPRRPAEKRPDDGDLARLEPDAVLVCDAESRAPELGGVARWSI